MLYNVWCVELVGFQVWRPQAGGRDSWSRHGHGLRCADGSRKSVESSHEKHPWMENGEGGWRPLTAGQTGGAAGQKGRSERVA